MPWQAWFLIGWFFVNMLLRISYGAERKRVQYEPVDAVAAPVFSLFLIYCVWAVAT